MKICHLTSVHPHTDTRILIKECMSLVKAGLEVHFVAPGAPTSVIGGVQIHGVTKETANRLKRMTKTVDRVYKKGLEIDADVYHFHDPELIPTGLKLKRLGKKVIYDVHEDVPRDIMSKQWINPILRKVIACAFEIYENRSARKFDLVITSTPFIRKRFCKPGSIAIDIKNYPLLNELNIKPINWSDKKDTVCYVGGITTVRGINEMVQSLPLSGDKVKMILGGSFANASEKAYAETIEGWGQVIELGYLDREQVYETYRKSKLGMVVLHPISSFIDSLPIKMFEYMSVGIPVIASDFPLWKEIIEGNNCGICVDPLNPKEIANAINWIMENPVEAEKMGGKGRRAVETKYNWEAESEKLISAYESLRNK